MARHNVRSIGGVGVKATVMRQIGQLAVVLALACSMTGGCYGSENAPSRAVLGLDQVVRIIHGSAGAGSPVMPGARSVIAPVVSPDGRMFAFDVQPPAGIGVPHRPEDADRLVVADWSGRVLRDTGRLLTGPAGWCGSISAIEWVGLDRLGVRCHENPTILVYGVTRLATGAVEATYYGQAFFWSPDRRHLAQIGPVPHFAPPWAQNPDVLIDAVTVGDARHPGGDDVHAPGDIMWAPDSSRIAYVDILARWKPRSVPPGQQDSGDGDWVDQREFLVISTVLGPTRAHRLNACAGGIPRWEDAGHVHVQCRGRALAFDITDKGFSPFR